MIKSAKLVLQHCVDLLADVDDHHPEEVDEGNQNDTGGDSESGHQRLVAPVQDGVDKVVALLAGVQLVKLVTFEFGALFSKWV